MKELYFVETEVFKLPDLLDILGKEEHIYFAEPHWWGVMEFIFGRELPHVTGIGKVTIRDGEIE